MDKITKSVAALESYKRNKMSRNTILVSIFGFFIIYAFAIFNMTASLIMTGVLVIGYAYQYYKVQTDMNYLYKTYKFTK